MIVLGIIVALATLAAGFVLAWGIKRLPSVRAQVTALALMAVVLPLAAVSVSGLVMFHMGTDAEILLVSVAAALAAIWCALVVARTIGDRLESMRSAVATVADGAFDTRLDTDGPAELAAMARSFNAMAADVESYLSARRDLIVAVSHDLRSPLASLQAMIEATQDGIVEPDHYLGAMAERVQAMERMVADLFELSAIDAGSLELELDRIDPIAMIRKSLEAHLADADRRGVTLAERIDGEPAKMRCAAAATDRVLANIVDNALRHTPAGGTVAIGVRADAGSVTIEVTDTGPGFSEPKRATEPFWRDDTSRTADADGHTHAGLGLAIARGLMELQDGALAVANSPEGGARVTLTLPAV